MSTIEPPSPQSTPAPADRLAAAADILRRTQPWVRFLSVLWFIGLGLMALGGFGAAVAGLATGRSELVPAAIGYPILALVYLFPALFLFRYASRIREFVADRQAASLEAALDAQRSFWKFAGIVAIIGIALSAALIVLGVLFATAARMSG